MSPPAGDRRSTGSASHSQPDLVQKLLEENETLKLQLDQANEKLASTRAKLKSVASGYKEELRNTIALKKQLLQLQTHLQETEKEVAILREITGTDDVQSGEEYE
jgi:dynactin complex subunit